MMDVWKTWRDEVARCLHPPCEPPWWARGGHAQTLIGHFWPSNNPPIQPQPWIIDLPDGDRLHADWYPGEHPAVLVLFHGLGGSTESNYIRRSITIGLQQGMHVIAVNHRGAGDGAGLAHRPYHSGRAEDASAVISATRNRFPQHLVTALGFSLSGNILLLLLSGQRGHCKPDFGIAVNAPIGLAACSALLNEGFNRLYNMRFARRCVRDLKDRVKHGLLEELPPFPANPLLYDIDDLYTAPAGGFRDREDYYETCSAKHYLDAIDVPAIAITARTDPMVDVSDYEIAPNRGPLYIHIEEHGGHMGFFQRRGLPRRWFDGRLEMLLSTMIDARKGQLAHVPVKAEKAV